MQNVKKFSLLLFAAMLGAVLAIGGLRLMQGNGKAGSRGVDVFGQPVSYSVKNVTVPNFDFTAVSEISMPTVVHIMTTTRARQQQNRGMDPFDFFGDPFGGGRPQGPQMGSGSGVIISTDGYIVTNSHVVNGADEIEVVLYDKRSYKGEVIGNDPNTDMALVKIEADGLEAIKIGNSDDVKVGEWVLAVGNPFNLTSTVTAGIVSAKGRNIRLLGGGTAIESFIQTDAAVNPGNSGGALVNVRGELIGINTAIASQTGSFAGYSFAVPSNIMKKVVEDIRKFGEVQRGFLGIQIDDVDYKTAEEKGLSKPMGVLVREVSDRGAAEAAGLKRGDVVLKIDGKPTNSVASLQEIIGNHRPGDEVKVTVFRGGSEKDFTVKLLNKEGKIVSAEPAKSIKKDLAVNGESTSDELRRKFKIGNGFTVKSVEGNKMKAAGLKPGHIILTIDKQRIFTAKDIYDACKDKKGGLLMEVLNPEGKKEYLVLNLD